MATGKMTISVVDGARQPVSRAFIRVLDAEHNDVYAQSRDVAAVVVEGLQIRDNWRDTYTVQAFAKGYRDTGFHPVTISAGTNKSVALMMLPRQCRYDFGRAGWDQLKAKLPDLCASLTWDVDEAGARARYEDLQRDHPEAAAGLLNITVAMQQIRLSGGRSALSYLKGVIWNTTLARDRFFGWADEALLAEVGDPARRDAFAVEPCPATFHPGATCSYKQTQFDIGNVQLTFHGGERRTIDGVHCIEVEPDMDLYKDLVAHGLLEVLPNELTRVPTDPKAILALRWMAGCNADLAPFDPLYTIETVT